MRISKFVSVALLGFIPLVSAVPAEAATFSYTATSGNYGDSEQVSFTGLPNSPANAYSAFYANSDTFTGTVSGTSGTKTLSGWCVDFYDLLQGSGTYTLTKASFSNGVSNIPTGAAGAYLTQTQVGQIGALATYGSQKVNQNAVTDAAVQVAIWDVEYNKGSATGSPITPSDSAVGSEVTTLLANINPGNANHLAFVTNVTFLVGAGNQNMVTVSAVPLPGALPLFGSALVGVGALARRRRAKKDVG